MIICTYKINILSPDFKTVFDGVNFLCNQIKCVEGCNSSEAFFNQEDVVTILLHEEWTSVELLGKHLHSGMYKKVLQIMDMSIEQPDIRIFECNSVKGLPWLKNLLSNNPEEALKKAI